MTLTSNTPRRGRRILRGKEAAKRLGIGKTKFDDEFRPRLREIPLGERAFGFLEEDVDALIDQLIAQSPRPRSPRQPRK